MALARRTVRTTLAAGLFPALFIFLLFSPLRPPSAKADSSSFADFSQSVQNGDAALVRGVYVAGVLALPVVQQPPGDPAFVSGDDGEATQFRVASHFEAIGLLAHNYLAGRSFQQLETGQEVRVVYGDGRVETFVVSEVLRYRALAPDSPSSSFLSLDDGGTLSAADVFKRVYLGGRRVTFQTCIERDGQPSWGRLFVIAVPKLDLAGLDLLRRYLHWDAPLPSPPGPASSQPAFSP